MVVLCALETSTYVCIYMCVRTCLSSVVGYRVDAFTTGTPFGGLVVSIGRAFGALKGLMRVMAPGCDRFLNNSFLGCVSRPGAITPMCAITPIGVR